MTLAAPSPPSDGVVPQTVTNHPLPKSLWSMNTWSARLFRPNFVHLGNKCTFIVCSTNIIAHVLPRGESGHDTGWPSGSTWDTVAVTNTSSNSTVFYFSKHYIFGIMNNLQQIICYYKQWAKMPCRPAYFTDFAAYFINWNVILSKGPRVADVYVFVGWRLTSAGWRLGWRIEIPGANQIPTPK